MEGWNLAKSGLRKDVHSQKQVCSARQRGYREEGWILIGKGGRRDDMISRYAGRCEEEVLHVYIPEIYMDRYINAMGLTCCCRYRYR